MRDLSGTGQVYRFTLSQLLKSNANRITLLLMVLLAAVSMPLTALMRGESPEVSDTSSLTAVRLENRTALDLDFSGDSYWADTVFSAGAEDPDAVVTVSGDVTGYQVAVSGADDVDQSELRLLADAVQTAIRDACVRAAGLTAQQLAQLEGSPLPEENFDGSRFWVQYGYSILAMMVCLMSASYVIRAVVEEKDSRLVELLLVSVKPMALLAGKILAPDVWHLVSLLAVLLVSLALGYLTMSIIGGVAGACCSGMEEAGEATGPVMLLTMAGYLASCVVGGVPSGTVAVFAALCPVLSIFCAPVQFACGNVSIWLVLLSWLIQAAVIFGLLTLAARVYAGLIVHRGSRVKWREVFSMAKGGAAR